MRLSKIPEDQFIETSTREIFSRLHEGHWYKIDDSKIKILNNELLKNLEEAYKEWKYDVPEMRVLPKSELEEYVRQNVDSISRVFIVEQADWLLLYKKD